MDNFEYQAIDSSGSKIFGQIQSDDITQAIRQLEDKGLSVIDVKVLKKSLFSLSSKVSFKDLEFFTSELSLLLDSGIRINRAIEIIRKTKANPQLALVLDQLSKDIQGGKKLSQAFRSQDELFDDLYCNLVEIGENTGSLPKVFRRLADDLAFRRELNSKFIGALLYPFVILLFSIAAILFIFNFVVPRMAVMFEGYESLPWYTTMVLNMSDLVVNYQVPILLLLLISIALISYYKNHSIVKQIYNEHLLTLPLLKNAFLITDRIRFNASMAMMLTSGLQVDKALRLSMGSLKNQNIKNELEVAHKKIKSGSSVASSLAQSALFPPFLFSLLEVGEETGNLTRVFDEIASRSKKEFEEWTKKVTTLLEPIMILFLGFFIGGIVVIMLLSMVSINEINV